MTAVPEPVLLTGATGFIGARLHRHLLDAGHSVRALIRPTGSRRAGLDPRCDVCAGDLTDPAAWRRALSGTGCVVHAAGTVRGRAPADFFAANVGAVAALVAALQAGERPERPVVLISSLAASRPELSDYARSKRAGEEILERAGGLGWTVLRPPAVYGPGDRELRPLLALMRRGLAVRPGPREQRLALIHVDDLARAVAACLAAPEACRQRAFEIDDGKPGGYDWDEIAAAVAGRRVLQVGLPGWLLRAVGAANLRSARMFRYAPMLTPGKARELQQSRWLCDNSAFSDATGWYPRITLEQGAAALLG